MPSLYETLLIVNPEADDDGVNAVIGDLRETVEKDGGAVLQAGVWERRKLAYQVKGHNEGIYVLMYADGNNTLPAALKDRMKLDEAVIRSMVVRLEDKQEADVRQQIAEADHSHDAEEIEAQKAAAEARHEAEQAAAAMSLEEQVAAEEAEEQEDEAEQVGAGTDAGEADAGDDAAEVEATELDAAEVEPTELDVAEVDPIVEPLPEPADEEPTAEPTDQEGPDEEKES